MRHPRHVPQQPSEALQPANEKVSDFSFSSHPSQEFLHKALVEYQAGAAAGKIFVDHAPTGTGKSWALATETIEQVATWPAGKTILFLAPEKRHIAPLLRDLKAGLPDVPVLALRATGEDICEHGLPADCPFRNKANSTEGGTIVASIEKTIELVRQFESSAISDQLKDSLKYDRSKLSKCCRAHVDAQAKKPSPDVGACRRCIGIFPGNRLFDRRDTALVAIATYDKLFHGLEGFEIANGRAKLINYSPFVSQRSGREIPFKDCMFVCEEYSHGHQRIVDRIEASALSVSVFEAAEFVVRCFTDAFQKVCMQIQSHHPMLYRKHLETLSEIESEVLEKRSDYWLVKEEVQPFKNGRACLLLKPDDLMDVKSFVTSMSPVYSSLFPSAKIGISLDDVSKGDFGEDCFRARVQRFDTSGALKKSGYASLPIAAELARMKILEPIAQCADRLTQVTAELPLEQREDFAGFFLHEVSQRDKNVAEYLRSLMRRGQGIRPGAADGSNEGRDLLDDFYLRGYEFMEAKLTDGRQISVMARLSRLSPEAMLHHLTQAGNSVYISSASATIRSTITNTDFDWLQRMKHPTLRLDHAAGQQVMAEKSSGKQTPEVVWADTGWAGMLDLTFNNKADAGAMQDTLNTFAASLVGDGSPATASRYAILFFNSNQNCLEAKAAFEKFSREAENVAEFDCHHVFAETFASGEMLRICEGISRHLESSERPRFFLVFSTYKSLATGANLHIDIETTPPATANLWAYGGNRQMRRYKGTTKLSVDISDVVLVEPVTSSVNETNFYRIGHQLAAMGEVEWTQIGRQIFERVGTYEPWHLTTAAVRRTKHFAAVQFDIAMQAIGRMDRTLNSAAKPRLFINRHFARIFASVTDNVIGETIIPPTVQRLMDSAKDRLIHTETLEKVDRIQSVDMSSSEFFSHLATLLRDSESARQIWIKTREYLANNQVASQKARTDDDAIKINALLSEYGIQLGDFYFEIPERFIRKFGRGCDVYFEREDNRFEFLLNEEAPIGSALTYNNPSRKNGQTVFIVRPDLMREVVWPVEYEKVCRHIIQQYNKKSVMEDDDVPPYLFERCDLFIQQCDACVDAKAWSSMTMSTASNQAAVEKLIADARMKVRFMQSEAPAGAWAPKRYVYAFRTWWPTLAERYGRVAVFFNEDNQIRDSKGDWDVAFVHVAEHTAIGAVLNAIDGNIN